MNKGKDIVDELNALSAGNSWPARSPDYHIPAGYFEQLPGQILHLVHNDDNISIGEELSAIAPALSALPRHTPLSVPDGYFASLQTAIPDVNHAPAGARVVPIRHRPYLKWIAAAASICSVVALSTLFFLRNNNRNSLDANLSNISDQEIVDYLQSHADVFDRDAIFSTVSQVEAIPLNTQESDLSTDELEQFLDDGSGDPL